MKTSTGNSNDAKCDRLRVHAGGVTGMVPVNCAYNSEGAPLAYARGVTERAKSSELGNTETQGAPGGRRAAMRQPRVGYFIQWLLFGVLITLMNSSKFSKYFGIFT